MELKEYRDKRHFERTTEPPPQVRGKPGPLTFVIQKHRARQLHYDFRLELNGVLKSWAVPKGPSLNPEDKHLAVMVEDHPLDYAGFEGAIPEGEYGAGEVIVWDNGTYSPDEAGKYLFGDREAAEAEMARGLEKGKISIHLRGHKLQGSWTLVKIQRKEKDWLLMKHRDEFARPGEDILKEERSVLSGRSIADIKSGKTPDPPGSVLSPAAIEGSQAHAAPATIAPMLASLAEGPFSNPDWIFEPKLDGYRIIAHVRDGQVSLLSRRGNNVTEQYAALVPELSRQPASEVFLDGEIIALDEKGRQCFQCLQDYLSVLKRPGSGQPEPYALAYYVFDILYLDGYDLRGATLRSRKELLRSVLRPTPQVKLVDYFEKEGKTVFEAAVQNGLEGVVGKLITSAYESGRRSRNWLKIKAMQSDEFVIGGYSVAEGGRTQTFSSLLLGYFDDNGKLRFAGHVGTGFDDKLLNDIKARLDKIRTDKCPFAEMPPLNAPTTWVKPKLVAEIKFSERTKDGRLRIPVFVRLREDKTPEEARRIEPVAGPAPPPETVGGSLENVLRQLETPRNSFMLEIEDYRISLSNLDKVLWPATDAHPPITKRHLLTYLASVSPYFLPQLQDRPLSLTRYPEGIHGEHFYQKHWEHNVPEFVQEVAIREESANSARPYMVCNNLMTLLWLGQVANLEFHTWFSRISAEPDIEDKLDTETLLDYPDFVLFDLDAYIYSGQEKPGGEPELNPAGFRKVCEVTLWLKEVLDGLTLSAFVKTSGKTGLHVFVPIKRGLTYKAVRSAAEVIGRYLVQAHPEDVTMEWAQEKRTGKVFIDYGQNVRGKTAAAAYSPRPTPEATVSTPLHWEELGKVYPTDFSVLTLPERLKATGDLWAGILSAKQDLNKLMRAK